MWYENFNYSRHEGDPTLEDVFNGFVGHWPDLESFLNDRFEMEEEFWQEWDDPDLGPFPFESPHCDDFFVNLMEEGLCLIEDKLGRHDGVFVFDLNVA